MSKRKLFHGTMNASKSAQLLMQVYNLERQGKTFAIFKPSLDSRDGDVIRSRALDETRDAIVIDSTDVGVMYSEVENSKVDFVFVDELQFFKKYHVDELSDISIDLGIPIFAYGLLISYTGEMFESSKRAIECGFTLHELKMQCDLCTSKSTHHALYVNNKVITDGSGIYVGDQEYRSVCYPCYTSITDASNNGINH